MELFTVLAICVLFLASSIMIGIATLVLLEKLRIWPEGGLATFAAYLFISVVAGLVGGLMLTVEFFS